jgi:hypothetical protein
VADVAYDAASATDLTNYGAFFASISTSDAILPCRQALNRLGYYPPMILAHGASFSDQIFLPHA